MGAARSAFMTVNRLLEPIIANPALMGRVGITVCDVAYTGRRSGREFRLHTWWRGRPDGGRIDVAAPGLKNWWRNFRGEGGPIEITVDGLTRRGHGRAVENGGKVSVQVTFDPA